MVIDTLWLLRITKYLSEPYLGILSHAMGDKLHHTNSPLPIRLKEARLAKGLSQKALGLAIGMDEFSASPRMNHYERGRHAPDFSILCQIAQLLEVPTAYFYAEEDWLAEVIKILANLPESNRNKLLKSIKTAGTTCE